jgi:hypothetical protein
MAPAGRGRSRRCCRGHAASSAKPGSWATGPAASTGHRTGDRNGDAMTDPATSPALATALAYHQAWTSQTSTRP